MILDDIVKVKAEQLKEEKAAKPLAQLQKNIQPRIIRDFEQALRGQPLSIIAEIKKASPSKGVILDDFDHREIAGIYEDIRIDAISVLTERHFFKGEDAYIQDVREISTKPVLRKDFIIDEYQIYQAYAIGADAILLIAAILPGRLKRYYDLAKSLGLHVLIEVHDEAEVAEALATGCKIIGINNRNLKTFTVDLGHTAKLMAGIPKDRIIVSESGIKDAADVKVLRELGVNAILVGETFMRCIHQPQEIEKFIEACKGVDPA